jgi:hypothetical protein
MIALQLLVLKRYDSQKRYSNLQNKCSEATPLFCSTKTPVFAPESGSLQIFGLIVILPPVRTEQDLSEIILNGNTDLYRCETWSLTLSDERRLRVFENRVLRRVFGPKREEVTGEWRKLHNEELSDLYSLPNIVWVVKSRRMRWAGHVARMEEGRGVYRVLVGKPGGKRPLGRPRRRWEDNIKMIFRKWEGGMGTVWS